jgi:ribonuclease III
MILDHSEIKEIEARFGLSFTDSNLLTTALLHKSYLNENRLEGKWVDWDRLYFLGQELFKLIIADLGFSLVSQNRGYISQYHADLLNNRFRERILEYYGCHQFIRRGKGSEADHLKPETLLNTLLAVIYIEHGYEKTRNWVKPIYLAFLNEYQETPNIDWKTSLQQWVQSKKGKVEYSTIGDEGPDHEKMHIVEVNCLERKAIGKGTKKKDAEKEAAKQFHIQFIPKSYWVKKIQFNPYKEPNIHLSPKRLKELKPFSKYFSSKPALLHQCLSQASFFNENRHLEPNDYGPLAYMGSWVYGFLYTDLIFRNFYKLNLSTAKDATLLYSYIHSNLETLNLINSLELPIEDYIWVGKGQRQTGIQDSIKVDVFQAFFGAHFMSTRFNDGRVSLTQLEELLEPWLFRIHEKYNRDEISPTSGLLEIIQGVSKDWEVKFETRNLKLSHEPEIAGIVYLLHKGEVVAEWQDQSDSGIDARNAAARMALKDVKGAINLQSSQKTAKKLGSFATDFFSELSKTSRQTKRTRKLTMQCGGLGVNQIINNHFVDGYKAIKSSLENAVRKGINFDSDFLVKIFQSYKTDFKLNQVNFNYMKDYLNDLTEWLQDLNLFSNPIEIDRFFDDIVESIQIFRHIIDEEMQVMSLTQSFEDLLLVTPRGLEISLKKESPSSIYGNDSFIKWFFYNVLTKVEDSRTDKASPISIEVNIKENPYSSCMTDVIIQFDNQKVEVEELQKSLKNIVHFSSVCFVQAYFQDSYLKFSFVNPFNDTENSPIVSSLFEWLTSIQIEHIKELSPIGGIIHDLKNSLVVLKRNLMMAKKSKRINVDFLQIRDSTLTKVNALKSFFSINTANYSHVNLLDFASVLSKELNLLARGRCQFKFSTGFEHHEVITDSSFLHSIITNLVKNSIESLKQSDGVVKLTMRMDYQDELLIRVEDNGCGISQERLSNLFTSFNSSKENIKGTGLGLPTIKRYVDILGGLMDVTSETNVGTTFDILIPLEIRNIDIAV